MQKIILIILLISLPVMAQTPTPSPTPIKIPNPIHPCMMDSTNKPSLAAWKAAHC